MAAIVPGVVTRCYVAARLSRALYLAEYKNTADNYRTRGQGRPTLCWVRLHSPVSVCSVTCSLGLVYSCNHALPCWCYCCVILIGYRTHVMGHTKLCTRSRHARQSYWHRWCPHPP